MVCVTVLVTFVHFAFSLEGIPPGHDDSTQLLQARSVTIDPKGKVTEVFQWSDTPTLCGKKCQCPQVKDVSEFATYFFQKNDSQWCFTTYTPVDSTRKEPWPVLLIPLDDAANDPNNYLKTMVGWSKYKLVPLLISGKTGLWPSGMPKVVTDVRPQPCVDKWMPYMRTMLDFIKGKQEFDDKNVYIFGFSSEGLWSLFAGYCFSSEIKGIFAAGAPITNRANPHPSKVPPKVATCDPPTCQYWPIFPCFDAKKPMKLCLASSLDDPYVYTLDLKYRALNWTTLVAREEGHDVVNIGWGALLDGKPFKGHAKIDDFQEWVVGCLGINSPCPESCWTGHARAKTSTSCRSCGLTSKMLVSAHAGSWVDGEFGPAPVLDQIKPPTSKCTHQSPDVSGLGGSPEDNLTLPDDYEYPTDESPSDTAFDPE